jgi:hypothetical protein
MNKSASFYLLPSQSSRSSKAITLRQEWNSWLHGLAPWTHAATFTCKRHSIGHKPISEKIIIDVTRHLIRRINYRCFGKSAKAGKSVPVIATFGWGAHHNHPHLHFSFEAPATLAYEEFSSYLEDAADKSYWIDRQRCIKPYSDAGWIEYITEHGTDQLIVPCITPSASYST